MGGVGRIAALDRSSGGWCRAARLRGVGSEGAGILLGAPLCSWVELSLLLKCLCWDFGF